MNKYNKKHNCNTCINYTKTRNLIFIYLFEANEAIDNSALRNLINVT